MMKSMSKMIEIERPPIVETAVLATVVLPGHREEEVEESLAEMERLAWTAGATIAVRIVQKRARPCPATLIGKGKARDLGALCDEVGADMLILDADLTPTQGVKLEEAIGRKVIDRTQLILDIFAQRARTNEGKHQVELAQLQYLLPRLAGRGSIMRQQGGIGVRGPGEQKLEVDRRVIRERIARLEAELSDIRKRRQTQRKRRSSSTVPTVALVGYTNAGKSSLLNALTDAEVLVEDKLFATLDPTARRCAMPSGQDIVLADTVGFVRKLPHSLVAAFRASLEEVNQADLLLLVADASHPAVEEHIQTVHEVLEEIQAEGQPMLLVFNKRDVADPARVRELMRGSRPSLAVSARTGEGLPDLLDEIARFLQSLRNRVRLRIPQSQAGLLAQIHGEGAVRSQSYEGNEIVVEAEVSPALANRLRPFAET